MTPWWTFPLLFVATIGLSYALAHAGEPQSVWVWCSVLAAC